MEKKITSEIKILKEEFDFLHKKIGELEWERAMMFYERRAVTRAEIEDIEERLENYRTNIGIVIEKVKKEVAEVNMSNKKR